jgi:hypothetical protein
MEFNMNCNFAVVEEQQLVLIGILYATGQVHVVVSVKLELLKCCIGVLPFPSLYIPSAVEAN